MSIISFPLLLISFVEFAYSNLYYPIFEDEWPHCTNDGSCYSGLTLAEVEDGCDAKPNCFGFSISSGEEPYSGCWKLDTSCAANGFGKGGYDFFIRDPKEESIATGFVLAWADAWPHCDNFGACFSGISAETARINCQASEDCIGFSFSMDGSGNGCYKQDFGACAANGFGSGQGYGYYAKVGTFCAEGCYVERTTSAPTVKSGKGKGGGKGKGSSPADEYESEYEYEENMLNEQGVIPYITNSIHVNTILAFLAAANLVYLVLLYHGKQGQSKSISQSEIDPLLTIS